MQGQEGYHMEKFVDDDDGYTLWVRSNRDGVVVNCEKSLNPNSLMLHRADCRTITGTPTFGKTWTGDYIKVCSTDRRELHRWAREEVGGRLRPCGICDP
jgi:hypothetical protein